MAKWRAFEGNLIAGVMWLGLFACGGAPSPEPKPALVPTGERLAPNEDALRLPRVLESLPSRPYIDLGPVIVEPSPGQNHSEFLLQTADRLHADAFVLERLALNAAYRGAPELEPLKQLFGRPNRNEDRVYHGPFQGAGQPEAPPITGFYRALRFASPDLPPCILQTGGIEPEIARALEAAETLGEEHQILNTLLASGMIGDGRYQELRAQCIAQDPMGPGTEP